MFREPPVTHPAQRESSPGGHENGLPADLEETRDDTPRSAAQNIKIGGPPPQTTQMYSWSMAR
jgi:hypothetical protein